jgi:CRP-like cAMP-binding protein
MPPIYAKEELMKAFFKQLNMLTDDELNQLDQYITKRTLKKGDFLIREGKICDEVVYISSGILRSFYLSDKGGEITYCLTFEGNMMTAFSSLITGKPTEESIQALTDVELLVIKKASLDALYESANTWLKVGKYLTELQYVGLENRIFSYQKYSAKKRYEELMAKQPGHILKIPVQHLASFLNITPRHLSRLRKEISQEVF